jgi:hypothetical protein
MTTIKNLATLPALTSAYKPGAQRKCACGCPGLTARTFVPGHDARLKGLIIRVVRGIMSLEDVNVWAETQGEGIGASTVNAVETAMANAQLMRRWNLAVEVAGLKAKIDELADEAPFEQVG